MAGLGFLKEAGLRLIGRMPVAQAEDLFTQVPDSLKNNGGVPPAKPESRPKRVSARALRQQLDEAAAASLTSKHVFHAQQ
jgi:hypothetical protein